MATANRPGSAGAFVHPSTLRRPNGRGGRNAFLHTRDPHDGPRILSLALTRLLPPMTARAIGAIAAGMIGRRKQPNDPNCPTDPVRSHSYDVEDPRAQPGRRVGNGSKAHGWAFTKALRATADQERCRQYDGDLRGPARLNEKDISVLEAMLRHLDYMTGELTLAIGTIATKARVSRSRANIAIGKLEQLGFIAHVRRSVKVDARQGMPGPRRKQTSNAYFFDCRRSMAPALFKSLMIRLLQQLRVVLKGAKLEAAKVRQTFNERAKASPRGKASSALQQALDRLEASIAARDAVGVSASP